MPCLYGLGTAVSRYHIGSSCPLVFNSVCEEERWAPKMQFLGQLSRTARLKHKLPELLWPKHEQSWLAQGSSAAVLSLSLVWPLYTLEGAQEREAYHQQLRQQAQLAAPPSAP